jgi:hypothetical protein
MKLADMGLAPLDLGARVVYTHRASSYSLDKDLRDIPKRSRRAMRVQLWGAAHRPYRMPQRRSFRGSAEPLHRAVIVWPEQGTGVVCGLTWRQEGHLDGGTYTAPSYFEPGEYEPPSLAQRDTYPLYVVRTHLTGVQLLVPPWACVPVDRGYTLLLGLDGVPISVHEPVSPLYDRPQAYTWPAWVESKLRVLSVPVLQAVPA